MRVEQTRPQVDITGSDLGLHTRTIMDHLAVVNKEPTLFSQNGRLVICEVVNGDELRLISNVEHAQLRTWLTFKMDFTKLPAPTRQNPQPGPVSTIPPPPLLDALLQAGEWDNIPELRDVSELAIVTRFGEIVEEAGYHSSTRIFIGPIERLGSRLLEDPTMDHVERAKNLLLMDVLGDFDFKEEEDRANALAAIVTAPTRFMYDCPLPLYLFDSTNPGSGKGTLAAVIGEMWGGAQVQPMPDNEEELRKRLLPALGATERVIVFDNVEHKLGGPTLNALLTSTVWSDRVLGSSKTMALPNNKLWCATGNNIELGQDMPRRCVWVMQDPDKNPSGRVPSDFRHPEIVRWVQESQLALRWAVLTLVARWIADGMPLSSVTCDNMTPWAQTVGGILENVGIQGFLRDRLKGGGLDAETRELLDFLDALHLRFEDRAFTVKDAAALYDIDVAEWTSRATLLEASPQAVRAAAARSGGSVSHSLGRYLAKATGRFAGVGGGRIVEAEISTERRPVYKIEIADVSHGEMVAHYTGL